MISENAHHTFHDVFLAIRNTANTMVQPDEEGDHLAMFRAWQLRDVMILDVFVCFPPSESNPMFFKADLLEDVHDQHHNVTVYCP